MEIEVKIEVKIEVEPRGTNDEGRILSSNDIQQRLQNTVGWLQALH
jgi:hypothetical protein